MSHGMATEDRSSPQAAVQQEVIRTPWVFIANDIPMRLFTWRQCLQFSTVSLSMKLYELATPNKIGSSNADTLFLSGFNEIESHQHSMSIKYFVIGQ